MPARPSSANLTAPALRRRGEPMPNRVEPMLATLAAGLPANAGDYAFEFKWDGVRALSFFERSRMRLLSRNLLDITARYPELHAMVAVFGDRSAILDGEIVALDENDRTSFSLLQRRMHANPHAALRLVHEIPVYYVLFDVLYLDGHSTVRLPYLRRREMLEELTLAGPSWRVCPSMVGDGGPMWETARKHAMEGIVAKRLDSVYEPGRRSPAWLKIKLVQRQEFVVGGWRTERGSSRSLGALLIGYHDAKDGKLHYAGSLGTGFNGRTLAEMEALLLKREVGRNPFAETVPGSSRGSRDVHYVRPDLVVEAEFRRWPKEGLVQQASFKGLRTDKRARDVVREEPEWT